MRDYIKEKRAARDFVWARASGEFAPWLLLV